MGRNTLFCTCHFCFHILQTFVLEWMTIVIDSKRHSATSSDTQRHQACEHTARTMASFCTVPPELRIMMLEHAPDIRALYSLVTIDADLRAHFRHYARELVLSAIHRAPNDIQDKILDAVAAHFSFGSTQSQLNHLPEPQRGFALVWTIPSSRLIWTDNEKFNNRPFAILQTVANMVSEVEDLAAWCFESRQHAECTESQLGVHCEPPLEWTMPAVLRTVWLLKLFVVRMLSDPLLSRHKTVPRKRPLFPPDHFEAYAQRVMHRYLKTLGTEQLLMLANVLDVLENQYLRLKRHQLRPQEGGVIDILFVGDKRFRGWTTSLKDWVHSVARKPEGMMFDKCAEAVAKTRRRRPRSVGSLDVLQDIDHDEYSEYLSKGLCYGPEHFLEHFRPLLGLPFGSTLAVNDLVGVGIARNGVTTQDLSTSTTSGNSPEVHASAKMGTPLGRYLEVLGTANLKANQVRRTVDESTQRLYRRKKVRLAG